MKKYFFLVSLFTANLFFAKAQGPYSICKDEKHPDKTLLKGIITKYVLQNDTTFNWYGSSKNSYTPGQNILKTMAGAKDKLQFILFGGTWCEDTQFILPKFFKLQEQSGISDSSISFFAVDRSKQTLGNIASAFKITNVPTIIVMKDGKELGRVVEYGKTGEWDKELAEIID